MFDLLTVNKEGLPLSRIVTAIQKIDPNCFSGKTPVNSLYSIIYRREKKRIELGEHTLFDKYTFHRETLYKINKESKK